MTGTVMERSHAKLTQWAAAFVLAATSKKGFAAHQLMRAIGCQYNTAWFLHHRVMEAMRRGGLDLPPMGGEGKVVEVDETYFGKRAEDQFPKTRKDGRPFRDNPWSRARLNRRAIVALVERGGEVRSFHVPSAHKDAVVEVVLKNISRETRIHTDESGIYHKVGKEFSAHETVNHGSKEYARGDVTTNTVEGYFGIFKRGMRGVYQHCAEKHLHRYLAEFDFRYNNRAKFGVSDGERAAKAPLGIKGKRLTYRPADKAAHL